MKLNQKNRFSGRATNGNRGPKGQVIFRNTALESTGPAGKVRGTALQLVDKYQAGAKDAQTQGDDVLFQTCLQYADHYLRLQSIAIENEQAKSKPEEKLPEENEPSESSETSEMEDKTPVIEKKEC